MSEPAPPRPRGLFCPHCHGVRLTFIYSRNVAPGVRVRYRKCATCEARIKTKEIVVKWRYRLPN